MGALDCPRAFTLMYRLADLSSKNQDRPAFSASVSPFLSPNEPCRHCQALQHKKAPVHGAGLYFRVNPPKRYLWGLNMTAALLASLYFTYMMLVEYMENRSATRITAIQNDTMLLPTIYACPKNPDTLNYDVLFKDIAERTGITTYNETRDILLYFIAGSGFQNTNLNTWDTERLLNAQINFGRWRGERSTTDLFTFVFSKNGITCTDMFSQCVYGGKPLNCCEIFSPSYVLMRGRCMRLSNFEQLGATEGDRLVLSFATPETRLVDNDLQKQFVIYLGDDYPEIAMYPRLYLTVGYIGKLRLKSRQVHMIHKLGVCNFDEDDKGKYTCFVNHWLEEYLIGPYNCTLPYYSKVRAARGVRVCETETVVGTYQKLLDAATINYRCLLNCERWDYFFKYTTLADRNNKRVYNMEIYYPDVFYELYSEIQIISWPNFISQVGGQIVLFLGTSIISLIYILTSVSTRSLFHCRNWMNRRRRQTATQSRWNFLR